MVQRSIQSCAFSLALHRPNHHLLQMKKQLNCYETNRLLSVRRSKEYNNVWMTDFRWHMQAWRWRWHWKVRHLSVNVLQTVLCQGTGLVNRFLFLFKENGTLSGPGNTDCIGWMRVGTGIFLLSMVPRTDSLNSLAETLRTVLLCPLLSIWFVKPAYERLKLSEGETKTKLFFFFSNVCAKF